MALILGKPQSFATKPFPGVGISHDPIASLLHIAFRGFAAVVDRPGFVPCGAAHDTSQSVMLARVGLQSVRSLLSSSLISEALAQRFGSRELQTVSMTVIAIPILISSWVFRKSLSLISPAPFPSVDPSPNRRAGRRLALL